MNGPISFNILDFIWLKMSSKHIRSVPVCRSLIWLVNVTLKPFKVTVTLHVETHHLICYVIQMTGFYMECNTGLKWFDRKVP